MASSLARLDGLPAMRIDWRRVLIYTHRWMGIAGCLIFLMWFVSGVVMMYARMPRLTPEERLARLVPLNAVAISASLASAARTADVAPSRVRVGMLGDRPVYRLFGDGAWTTVYADTGERLRAMSAADAVTLVRQLVPEHASTMHAAGRLTSPDQWTLDGGLPRFLPMQRVALGDELGTMVYVSERTGEPVMKTTARGRMWGYAGAVLHWTYFTPFRLQRELWRYSIIYVALAGCVMCLSGLFVGIWRYSPSARYRLMRVPAHSPYAGWMWWHHYAGLLFGLFSFTWALSGALSLTPWDWAPSTEATVAQQQAASGGPLRLDLMTPDTLRAAATQLASTLGAREIEVGQFAGRPFAMAYRTPSLAAASASKTREVSAIYDAHVGIEHHSVWLDRLDASQFTRVGDDELAAVARNAMPDAAVREVTWLTEYDDYYYDRTGTKPLPVLRVTYGDEATTGLYFDAATGQVAMRQTTRSRINRWLYNGLHSLDFPFLYYARPGWDAVALVLSAGGIALTITTMLPAWRRLRRHGARWRGAASGVGSRASEP